MRNMGRRRTIIEKGNFFQWSHNLRRLDKATDQVSLPAERSELKAEGLRDAGGRDMLPLPEAVRKIFAPLEVMKKLLDPCP